MSSGAASLWRNEGLSVLDLHEETGGQHVRVLPDVGASIIEYRVRHGDGQIPLLDPPPDFRTVARDPTRWGCPVLFPFPNRIRDGRFSWERRSHRFTESFLDGHHIHGLVYGRPWELERCDVGTVGSTASVVARLRFRSEAYREIGEQYPYPFELEATYALGTGGLVISFTVQNVGSSPMPMGIGLHPYLRAPSGPARTTGRIRVPAEACWELKDLLPTGRILPVSGPTDLRSGRSLEGLELDAVLTRIEGGGEAEPIRCELEDGTEGIRTVLEAERVFREFVIYTVPGRASVCIEPYTCATDAPNLQAQGIDAGLRVLPPGERFRARIRLRAERV